MSTSFDLTIDDTRDQLARHARASLEAKPSLIGMSREEMAAALIAAGVPERQVKMRISQLWHWLYVRGVSDFADMRNISKDLRAMLAQHFTIARPEVVEEQISQDGTRKWLFRFPPRGAGRPVEIESVYIPEEGRGTLCISSQVGCTLTCSFCHTGTQKLVRNLTSEEILAQLLTARDRLGDFPDKDTPDGAMVPAEGRKITNIVMMGMGEPLYNFEEVKKALLIASDGDGLSLSSAASRFQPPASCRRFIAPATRLASCSPFRYMPCATSCATFWCRSTKNIRWLSSSKPAANIRACRTPSASRLNM